MHGMLFFYEFFILKIISVFFPDVLHRMLFMTKKILLVDDSMAMRLACSKVLTPEGYEVLHAENGIVGLEQLEKHPDVSLIICDINMPKMGGVEMMENIKKAGKHTAVPIIVVSSEASMRAVEGSKTIGVKGWLVKPFTPEQLKSVVARYVK